MALGKPRFKVTFLGKRGSGTGQPQSVAGELEEAAQADQLFGQVEAAVASTSGRDHQLNGHAAHGEIMGLPALLVRSLFVHSGWLASDAMLF